MDWQVGEIRQVNGEWYKCIESCDCPKCDLRNCTSDIHCTTLSREDGKEVIFKKLDISGLPKSNTSYT